MPYENPAYSNGPQTGKTSAKSGSKPSGFDRTTNDSDKGDRPAAKPSYTPSKKNGYDSGGIEQDTSFSGHGKKSKIR